MPKYFIRAKDAYKTLLKKAVSLSNKFEMRDI
jgi:hypothetical protein